MKTSSDSTSPSHYVVTYRDPEKVMEQKTVTLKVRNIGDSELGLSFIRLSDFVFEDTGPIVNPLQENLRRRFENTKHLHLSIYNVISIEEVGADHSGFQFKKDRSNLYVIPVGDRH